MNDRRGQPSKERRVPPGRKVQATVPREWPPHAPQTLLCSLVHKRRWENEAGRNPARRGRDGTMGKPLWGLAVPRKRGNQGLRALG